MGGQWTFGTRTRQATPTSEAASWACRRGDDRDRGHQYAIVVFMLVMVPFATLLARSDSAITNTQDSVTASGILNAPGYQGPELFHLPRQLVDHDDKADTDDALHHTSPGRRHRQSRSSTHTSSRSTNAAAGGVLITTPNHTTSKTWGTGTCTATVPATYHVVIKVLWHSNSHGTFTSATTTWFVRDTTELPSNDTKAPTAGTTVE